MFSKEFLWMEFCSVKIALLVFGLLAFVYRSVTPVMLPCLIFVVIIFDSFLLKQVVWLGQGQVLCCYPRLLNFALTEIM